MKNSEKYPKIEKAISQTIIDINHVSCQDIDLIKYENALNSGIRINMLPNSKMFASYFNRTGQRCNLLILNDKTNKQSYQSYKLKHYSHCMGGTDPRLIITELFECFFLNILM